jgi:hypothetical protein
MPLNIKDEFIHQQAKQLASLTGQSITAVVRQALTAQLSAVRRQQNAPAGVRSAENLLTLARTCATLYN